MALSRVFPREVEASYWLTFGSDSNAADAENDGHIAFDPWRAVLRVANANKDGLSRGLKWLSVLACSGVEIPVPVFMRFSALSTEYNTSIATSLLLVKSVMSAAWLKCTGQSELQLEELFSEQHARLTPQIIQCLEGRTAVEERCGQISFVAQTFLICISQCFIQVSLGTCLLLYGCDRSKITEHKLIKEEDVKGLPLRFVVSEGLWSKLTVP